MARWSVDYQIATYSGSVEVNVDDDADKEEAIGKAKRDLQRRYGQFPFGMQAFKATRLD